MAPPGSKCAARRSTRSSNAERSGQARQRWFTLRSEDDAAAVQESVEAFVDDVVATVGHPKSLAADVQPIFAANCTSCHSGPFSPQDQDLAEGQAFTFLVNVDGVEVAEVKRVLPGDPDNSYLFWKITDAPGIANSPMPLGSFPMTQREIRMIRRWIEQGALDRRARPGTLESLAVIARTSRAR